MPESTQGVGSDPLEELDDATANLCRAYASWGEFAITIRSVGGGIRLIHCKTNGAALAKLLRNAAEIVDDNVTTAIQ